MNDDRSESLNGIIDNEKEIPDRDKPVPSFVPQSYFGVSPEIIGCGVFLDDFTFAHVSGRLLISESYKNREQKFFQIPKFGQHLISAVAFDIKRTIMVVADEGDPPMLNVFRLKDHANILTFIPKNCESKKFTSMFVHCDCERVSALLGPPENLIYTIHLGSKNVEAITEALPKDTIREITQIIGHQEDTFHYAVLGIGLLRFLTWMGDIWEDIYRSFSKADGIPITCGTYTSIDTLLIGTADGKLMLVSYDGIKAIFDPLTVERFEIEIKKKGVKPLTPLEPPSGNVHDGGYIRKNEVKFMQSFKRGIVYIVKTEKEEVVRIMLKGRFGPKAPFWIPDISYNTIPDDDPFPKHGYLKIHVGRISEYDTIHSLNRPLFEITNLAINVSGTCLVLTFAGRFLMILDLKDDFNPPKKVTLARMVNVGYNKCPVENVTSCLMKNIFLTAGEKTVKLYDYKFKEAYILYRFEDNIHSISLHPSGCFGLISLTDKTVLFGIQQQTFLPIVEVDVECCRYSTFSDGGNLMVIAEETKMRVYSVYTFKQISEIVDGQAGKISSMKLCHKNNHIWTSRTSGALSQTNVNNGIIKYIFPCSPVASFDEYDNFRKIYFTGFDGTVEELDTTERCITMKIDIKHGNLTDLLVSKAWSLIILGTETGYIVVYNCPLKKDDIPLFKVKMHYAPIIKIALSKDETRLFSSAKDGSICIWKIMVPNTEIWDGTYAKSEGYPIPANYKDSFDSTPIQLLVDYEMDYFNRQEKLMWSKPKSDIFNNLKSLLDCLKEYELRGVLHPPTKFRRFQHHEYWHNLHVLGRDHLLEEQFFYEKSRKQFYDQTQDYVDVFKYFEKKTEEFKERYLVRMKQSYEIMKDNNNCLTGLIFHDVKGDVVQHIKQQKKFCQFLKNKVKQVMKEIELKGRNYIDMKSSPNYLKFVRKERQLRQRAKDLMRTVLHRKILKIIHLFKTILEAKKLCASQFSKKATADESNSEISKEIGEGSDAFSFIHSEDPSDSINNNYAYLIQKTPTSSVAGVKTKTKKLKWPNQMTQKCDRFLKDIKNYRGKNYNPNFKLKEITNSEIENKISNDNLSESESGLIEKVVSESYNIVGDTFVIEEDRGLTKGKSTKSFYKTHSFFKKRNERKLLAKILSLKKKMIKIENTIKEFTPDSKEPAPIKMPLVKDKCAYLINNNYCNTVSYNMLHKNFKNTAAVSDVNFDDFPTMYDHFRHTLKFVTQVSPFHALKHQILRSKLKNILMNYSVNSKLSKLAAKHLVSSRNFIKKKIHKTEFELNKLSFDQLTEYDPFSEMNLRNRNFDDYYDFMKGWNHYPTKTNSIKVINAHQKRPLEEKLPKHHSCLFNEYINAHEMAKKIKLKQNWERLCQLSYPFERQPNELVTSVPTEEYKDKFEKIFKMNLTLPKSTLPILKQLMQGHTSFSKRLFQNRSIPAFFPLKDLWILKSIDVLKCILLPTDKAPIIVSVLSGKNEKQKDKYDLFQNSTVKRAYMRVGKLDQLPQERLNHNLCHRDKWLQFNPVISKELMSVLIGHDLLYDLEKSSYKTTSGKSSQTDLYEPGLTHYDENEFTIKPSDTDIYKNYMLKKEKSIPKFADITIPKPSEITSSGHMSAAKSDEFSVDDFSIEDLPEEGGKEEEESESMLEQYIPFEELNIKNKMMDFDELELQALEKDVVEDYNKYIKNYEEYFEDKILFPMQATVKTKSEKVIQNEDEETEIIEIPASKSKNQSPPKENSLVKETAKDGRKKVLQGNVNLKIPSASKKKLKNTKQNLINKKSKLEYSHSNEKVTAWLADTKKDKIEVIKKRYILKDEVLHDSSYPLESTNLLSGTIKSKSVPCEDLGTLVKDGVTNCILEKERERLLWERLYHLTFHPIKKVSPPLITPYNLKLWAQIFKMKHPKTIESFHDIIPIIHRGEDLELESFPDLSYDLIFKDSLPKEKCPDDPSDEIITISSEKYIIYEDNFKKSNKYSIYTNQKVQIKTKLKNKVWFIPDDQTKGTSGEGKFYYPGYPIWHKGHTSPFLEISGQSTVGNSNNAYHKLDAPFKKYLGGLKNIYKGENKHLPHVIENNLETIRFKRVNLRFGLVYMLPFKYKRFWKVLEKVAGDQFTQILFSLFKESKHLIKKGKEKVNPKSLIVTYNRALLNILVAFKNEKKKYIQASDKQISLRNVTLEDFKLIEDSGLLNEMNKVSTFEETEKKHSLSVESTVDSSEEYEITQGNPPSKHNSKGDPENSKNLISKTGPYANEIGSTVIKVNHNRPPKITKQSKGVYLEKKSSYLSKNKHEEEKSSEVSQNKNDLMKKKDKQPLLYFNKVGIEWGLYKYFANKINKPHIYNAVKVFENALFEWIKSQNKKENLHSLWKQKKIEVIPHEELLMNEKKRALHTVFKIRWPESIITEVKKSNMSKTCPLDNLSKMNRKIKQFHRHRHLKKAFTLCAETQSHIPETNRLKMSILPKHFTLEMLDGNYSMLRKINEHFMYKRLRHIQNYCKYRSKLRRSFHELNIRNANYSKRESVYRKNLEKTEEFFKEYNRHRAHMLLWIDKIKISKEKLNSTYKMANNKWEHLEMTKKEVLEFINMSKNVKSTEKFKAATKALIQKLVKETPSLIEYRNICRKYENFVTKNMKLERNFEPYAKFETQDIPCENTDLLLFQEEVMGDKPSIYKSMRNAKYVSFTKAMKKEEHDFDTFLFKKSIQLKKEEKALRSMETVMKNTNLNLKKT